ncbi:MAG: glycosyltransferase [Acidobacteriota bacterium]
MSVPSVYFYCRDEEANLQEDVIALAEGLDALGIPHFANTNYWRKSTEPGDYLLRHDRRVTPDDCDVVVVSYTWPTWMQPDTFKADRRPLPGGLFKAGRRYRTVYMDSHDGYRTVSWEPEFRQFDIILRAKLNARAWHPANQRPWALGLNNRILDATAGGTVFGSRAEAMLVNFGASHPYAHGTREVAAATFEPRISRLMPLDRNKDDLSKEPADPFDALLWRQTGHRFSRAYYERLKRSQSVACFCGDMIPAAPFQGAEQYLAGGGRARLRRIFFDAVDRFDRRPRRAIQWDSFRFWESLAAGCATFNIDLEHYGVRLPVMPVNGEHYLGIRFDAVDDTIDRIAADDTLLERVAAAGREWALMHYSPSALAQRLLDWTR